VRLFAYRTDVAIRGQAPVRRVWLGWLLLVLAVVSSAALVLGVLYWLATFDVDTALHALGGLFGLVASPG
jgi:hypothetical protein